jgi:hypothetical protein
MKINLGTHIPVTGIQCDSCHTSTAVDFTSYTPSFHGVVTGTACALCHSGAYKSQGNAGGALGKPNNHIPDANVGALGCNSCHTSTSAWTTEKMNHNNLQTGCIACHLNGITFLGNMQKAQPGKHNGSKAGDDCSKSGCHRPLGTQGSLYKSW